MGKDRIAAAVSRIERDKDLDAVERLNAVRSMGFVPSEVGPEVSEAPARGAVEMVEMKASYPKGEDDFEVKPAGFLGRKTLRCADAFDLMAAKAMGRNKPVPFTLAQVSMGRHYRNLVEKHESAGVRCSSLESLSDRSGGGGGGYMDALLDEGRQIEALRRRIGAGAAREVRRHRPSARGSRRTIMDRRLVDIVCLEDGTIADVLRQHGWANDAKVRASLQKALAAILDRMMGPVRRGGESVVHYG